MPIVGRTILAGSTDRTKTRLKSQAGGQRLCIELALAVPGPPQHSDAHFDSPNNRGKCKYNAEKKSKFAKCYIHFVHPLLFRAWPPDGFLSIGLDVRRRGNVRISTVYSSGFFDLPRVETLKAAVESSIRQHWPTALGDAYVVFAAGRSMQLPEDIAEVPKLGADIRGGRREALLGGGRRPDEHAQAGHLSEGAAGADEDAVFGQGVCGDQQVQGVSGVPRISSSVRRLA